MNKIKSSLLLIAALAAALPLQAQRPRLSPHETITANIDGNDMKLVYGRPYSRDPKDTNAVRKIWGTLVPYGKIWRTGADQATLITTAQPIVIGETTIPAGTYSVWTLPLEDGTAKLAINKQIGQWGINPSDPQKVYDEKNDVGRFDLKKEKLDKTVDQFTMAIEKNPSGGGVIKMMWENTQFSVPFTVKK